MEENESSRITRRLQLSDCSRSAVRSEDEEGRRV